MQKDKLHGRRKESHLTVFGGVGGSGRDGRSVHGRDKRQIDGEPRSIPPAAETPPAETVKHCSQEVQQGHVKDVQDMWRWLNL